MRTAREPALGGQDSGPTSAKPKPTTARARPRICLRILRTP